MGSTHYYESSVNFIETIRLIKIGDTIELRHALDGGLDPNHSNEIGTTLLMLAAMEGNTAIGGLLIDRGAELDRVNKMRDSALTLAAWFKHPKFVRLLLDCGASLGHIRDGGSLDSFLRWVEDYCGMTSEQTSQLRNT
jgi:ankyrin repeat protein